jgi:hypothetical protein
MSQSDLNRRRFLKAAAFGAAAGAAAGTADLFGQAKKPDPKKKAPVIAGNYKTRHVVFLIFGGGVRTRDVIGQREDCPNINKIAAAGALVRGVRARDAGHYGSTLSLVTGLPPTKMDETVRGTDPTIFELVRKHKKLPPPQVWLTAAGVDWHSNLSFGNAVGYGVKYSANYLAGDGAFTSELADVTAQFGEPKVPDDAERSLLARLQAKIDNTVADATRDQRPNATPQEIQDRVRKYVMEELSGRAKKGDSSGQRDIQAIHYGTNILAVFKPMLLTMVCAYADLGHQNRDRYHRVIHLNDREIGRLWDTIQTDAELKNHTSLFIMPEFGRDTRENAKGGLDHGDGGPDHNQVFMVAAGPDFKKGMLTMNMETTDVAATILHLLDVRLPAGVKTGGKVLTELLNG